MKRGESGEGIEEEDVGGERESGRELRGVRRSGRERGAVRQGRTKGGRFYFGLARALRGEGRGRRRLTKRSATRLSFLSFPSLLSCLVSVRRINYILLVVIAFFPAVKFSSYATALREVTR